ncbi:LCP family protein [Zafaria sp. J156]|uniref:LCP family protein n=1 Tax=Zafaria sp. J156 TaxID=3116490 RepID=UPI002E76B54F|nr:LCP family protein [Zafaria sp. J156]MEE1620746.1 LCP family protein [Zafaria sp. J156]
MTGVNELMGQDHEPAARKPRKRRPVVVVIVSLLVLVAVAGAIAFGYLFSLMNSFESKAQRIESVFPSDAARPETSDANKDALNFLLIGSDVRGGSGETEDLPSVPNGGRSDTMMLVNIPGDRSSINVMSVMRDTWVEIPGQGSHKINAALAFGGIPLLVETLEGMFEVPIDHVAIIDFEGFQSLTDALGGVTVNNPRAFTSTGSQGEHFPAGPVLLDGESALKFVRERKQFSDGDYSRVANQQLFLKSLMSSFLTPDTLLNPGRISTIVDEFSPYVSVDEGLGGAEIGQLAVGLRDVRSGDVHAFTLPNRGVGRSADGQSIVVNDPEAVGAIGEALRDDALTAYVVENGIGN